MKLFSQWRMRRNATPRENAPTVGYVDKNELLALREFALQQTRSAHIPHAQLQAGQSPSQRSGSGVEFAGVRAYEPGDDIRHINWRLSARTGKPLTKLYTEEQDGPVYILLDQRGSMFFGSCTAFKSVVAARIAALISWMAFRKNLSLGGLVVGETWQKAKSQRSLKSVLDWFDLIASANHSLGKESCNRVSLFDAIMAARANVLPGSTVVIISDFSDFSSAESSAINLIAKRNRVKLIKVTDTLEDTMQVSGAVAVSDGSQLKAVSISAQNRTQYLESRALQHHQLQAYAASSSATLLGFNQLDNQLSLLAGTLERGVYGTA